MGLFENLGRKVESFKQRAEEASEETASRKCVDCGEAVYTGRSGCPECSGETVAVDENGETNAVDEDGENQ